MANTSDTTLGGSKKSLTCIFLLFYFFILTYGSRLQQLTLGGHFPTMLTAAKRFLQLSQLRTCVEGQKRFLNIHEYQVRSRKQLPVHHNDDDQEKENLNHNVAFFTTSDML